jgi:hypothetical protein
LGPTCISTGFFIVLVFGLANRFIRKAATIFIATGATFTYYLQDTKDCWLKKENRQFPTS